MKNVLMPFVSKAQLRAWEVEGKGVFFLPCSCILVISFLCSARRAYTHPKENPQLGRGRGPLGIRTGLEAGGDRSAETGGSRVPAFGPAQVRASGDRPGVVSGLQGQRRGAGVPGGCVCAYSSCVRCAGIRSVHRVLPFPSGTVPYTLVTNDFFGCRVIEI